MFCGIAVTLTAVVVELQYGNFCCWNVLVATRTWIATDLCGLQLMFRL
jgi:hypothetical protein